MIRIHIPSKDEADKVEMFAAEITKVLLEEGGGPGFAGAVLTVAMANILALLEDDVAEEAIKHHAENALKMRVFVRKALERMKH